MGITTSTWPTLLPFYPETGKTREFTLALFGYFQYFVCCKACQLETLTMKSYTIHHEEKQCGPNGSIAVKADVPEKKWKTILAILALIAAAFLIIKLQKPEARTTVFQEATMLEKTSAKSNGERGKKEAVNPTRYVKVRTSWRKNLVGETVLEGTLQNTAPIHNFKDPILLVTWLSKTNTVMGTSRYPLYEYLAAGRTVQFKMKAKAPSKNADVKVSIESATVAQ